ncbi:hypothetical protein [Erwinia amylovora]|uniref:hypothetical protein n=1 Tax=Erwinia amylovora TaxID=552 RepID=UPI0014441CB7|nr:hypothetical protein [Erwinia amylovora]
MAELIKTLLVGKTHRFELYGDSDKSSKVTHVVWTNLLNPTGERGKGMWIDKGDVDISRLVQVSNNPSARLMGEKDNDVFHVSEVCIALAKNNEHA